MKSDFIALLRCPQTRQHLHYEASEIEGRSDGWLESDDGFFRYPVRNGIPRFVPHSNYADNFGLQ